MAVDYQRIDPRLHDPDRIPELVLELTRAVARSAGVSLEPAAPLLYRLPTSILLAELRARLDPADLGFLVDNIAEVCPPELLS